MIKFTSAPSYFWLNAWVLANIIELATQRFCDRFVDFRIDPGHRLYDQMTQAARSIRANIAEVPDATKHRLRPRCGLLMWHAQAVMN